MTKVKWFDKTEWPRGKQGFASKGCDFFDTPEEAQAWADSWGYVEAGVERHVRLDDDGTEKGGHCYTWMVPVSVQLDHN